MDLYLLSDVHLFPEPENHPGRETFLSFLSMLSGKEPANLWIAGDLFDYWFEYRSSVPAGFSRTIAALRRLSDIGWKLDFLPGNHDWWVGSNFERATGMTIHRAPWVFPESDSIRIILAHGDGFGPGDTGYRLIKPLLRARLLTGLFSLLHPTFATFLARGLSGTSRRILRKPVERIPQGLDRWVKLKLREGADLVATGHTHLAALRELEDGRHLSLGDWLTRFTYSVISGDGVELKEFDRNPVNCSVKQKCDPFRGKENDR